MKVKIIKEVYSEKQRRFFCASDDPELKKKCDDPIKKKKSVKESTYVLDRDDDSGSTFDLGMDRIEASPMANAPQDERAKTWNRWKISVIGVAREYFAKDIVQGGMLEKFADRLTKDKFLLSRIEAAVSEGYMKPDVGQIIAALAMPANPRHKEIRDRLMAGEQVISNSAISYLTVLGTEFATILKNRAWRSPGEDAIEVMQDALAARFDNYILYGRGPAEQRDEFVKKSKEYGWSKKDNLPSMYDVRENKSKIKVKII